MRMERRSDSSPHSSDQTGTWIHHVSQWNEDSSLSGINIESSRELESLVEDKDVASKAVAFVVHSTRKGIVPLCADVASLLRSKKQLQDKVLRLKRENERLRAGTAGGATDSTATASPPASLPSYSDRASDSTPQAHDSNRRCSNSSVSSSNVSGSPKLEKFQHQRSPRLHRTSAFTLPNHVSPSPNQQLAVATVHYNPPNGLHSDAVLGPRGLRSRGHERKNSLPQMVAVPHEDIPKVIPKVRLEHKGVQCSLLSLEQSEKLEEQFRDTVKLNSTLAEELGAAKKEIEILKGRLKEFEMTQLARQCLDDFYVENECDGAKQKRKNSPQTPPCTESDRNPFKGIPLARRAVPVKIEGPIDNCRCVNCDQAKKDKSRSKSKPSVICDSQLREEVGIAMHDHVVVKGDRTGFVRYVGHLDNVGQPSAIFVGLELEAPVGRHDGVFNGKRYFSCLPDHGVMLPMNDVICLITEKEPSTCNSFRSGTSYGSTGSITTIQIGADASVVAGPSQRPVSAASGPVSRAPDAIVPHEDSNESRKEAEKTRGGRADKNSKDKHSKPSKKRECKVTKFFRRKELHSANERRFPANDDVNLKLPRNSPAVAEDIV